MIPQISNSQGRPTILMPLGFVVLVSMIKDIIEDSKRHSSDNRENSSKVLCIPRTDQARYVNPNEDGVFKTLKWSQIKVGQIVKVTKDSYFPADLLLLNSDDPQGICFVETKNLDGETNMKSKVAHKFIVPCTKNDHDVEMFMGQIDCQGPNEFLYKFEGNMTFKPAKNDFLKFESSYSGGTANISLDANQVLLRGSSLRNTEYIYGVVIYTGHETKIMKNSPKSRNKISKIEKKTNLLIIVLFFIEIIIIVFAAGYSTIWNSSNQDTTDSYLGWSLNDNNIESNFVMSMLINLGSWLLIFVAFIPISLVVTLEIIKFFQAIFITWDATIFDETKDMPAKVQSSNLNEELGQIEYIFSDKTGTLTQNIMEFKKMCIGDTSYGKSENDDLETYSRYTSNSDSSFNEENKSVDLSESSNNMCNMRIDSTVSKSLFEVDDPDITNVSFYDPHFTEHLEDKNHENHERIHKFLLHLALCHTVIIDKEQVDNRTKVAYNASSPDELALVNGARFFGYFFCDRDSSNNMIVKYPDGEIHKFKLLNIIEFDSARKRMTVIVQTSDGKIKVMCKGADSIIYPRLKTRDFINNTEKHLESYAGEGLRTLLLAEKTITEEEYASWEEKYIEATLATVNREEKVSTVEDEIEYDFELVGATAIEDRLQDDVANTISVLKEAGIKIWVLTGDKIETAINIGYSCKVLNNAMEQYIIDKASTDEIIDQLADSNKVYLKSSLNAHALIVAGDSLLKITAKEKVKEEFLKLSDKMQVVIACRVSPKQKAEVVNLIKVRYPNKTTLAIGDGANDVNMITAAHIGIGISGLEGQQAARASDYAIGQFKHLRTLLLVHGREAYRKNSFVVGYMFYKNILFTLVLFWFGLYSNFSGQTLFDEWLYQLYNIAFTALAIMWFAVFDLEYPKEILLTKPKYYIIGLENMCFSNYKFAKWVFYAVWQSFVLIIIGIIPFEKQGGSLWLEGNFVYLGIVIIANLNVLTSTNAHTFISLLFQIGSIIIFMISALILNWFKFSVLFGTIYPTYGSLEFYYILLLMSLAMVQVDVGVNYVNKKIRERMITITRSIKKKLQNMRSRKSTDSNPKPKQKRKAHHGFAFAEEPGNAPQLMDKIRSNSLTMRKSVLNKNKFASLESGATPHLGVSMFGVSPQQENSKNRSSSVFQSIKED